MKILLIAILFTLAVSSAFAQPFRSQGYEPCDQGYCEQPQIINSCREFLRQQCSTVTMPFLRSRMWQPSSCQVMRQQCCQQIQLMAQQSRCRAICNMLQAIMQQLQFEGDFGAQGGLFGESQAQAQAQAQAQLALNLPSMCGVYPNYCSTPCSMV